MAHRAGPTLMGEDAQELLTRLQIKTLPSTQPHTIDS